MTPKPLGQPPPSKLDRRQQILDVSCLLFQARGFHGTRMDDIADAIELNKGTLYHYYEGKASILFDIYMNASNEASALCVRDPQDRSAEEALRRFVHDTLALIASKPSLASVYFQESSFLDEWLTPDQVAIIRKREDELGTFVRGIIRQGIEEGSFRYTDARVAARGIIGMVSWYHRWMSRSHGDTEEISSIFTEMLIGGILLRDEESPTGARG